MRGWAHAGASCARLARSRGYVVLVPLDPVSHACGRKRDEGQGEHRGDDHPEVRRRLEDSEPEVHAHDTRDQRARQDEDGGEREDLP